MAASTIAHPGIVDRAGDRVTDAPQVDLLSCASEPIHIPGTIQPHGFLFVLRPDWKVQHVSANIAAFTGRAPRDWLGRPIEELITHKALHVLRNQLSMLQGPDTIQRCFAVSLVDGTPPLDVAIHMSGDLIVVEAEPAVTDEREAAALVRAMIARLKHSDGFPAFLGDGARHVQALTGFDRVMVYRFDSEGHGEVVAETLRRGADSYLGLHYPQSDIPAQARTLYLRNPFRIIADVAAPPVAIETAEDAGSGRLDQSLAVLRAVSPVHIEYLKNMGVGASLSISIIVDGKLWGLFACHHPSARLPSFAYRTAAELFGEIFSLMLDGRLRRKAADDDARDHTLAALLVAELQHDENLMTDPKRLGELIFDTIPADGIAVHRGDAIWLGGTTPDQAACGAIVAMLSARARPTIFATETLRPFVPADSIVAGVIAIPLMGKATDHLMLFRSERIRTVRWAGSPDKVAMPDGRLSPRNSFAAWAEIVRGRCEPFTIAELRAAETIRLALLDAQARTIQDASVAAHGQDLLISELNHRVRNILSLIRGLISQARGSAETTDSFISNLDDRVQSLARAHDQITSERWGPARLVDLLDTEAGAYLGDRGDRIAHRGPDILIQPAAFTTLAMVFHELMTNATKYGALSASGTVAIGWLLDDRGDLIIDWVEQGGPIVSQPTRSGFGSTLIARAIPYDLGGTAALFYPPAGFHAQFRVPAVHLAGLAQTALAHELASLTAAGGIPLAGSNVLVVEDSMIIALDCADTLGVLGADHVTIAASVDEALAAIDATTFHFALLDYNLGSETSTGIARILAERGIPYAFATGYDGKLQDHDAGDAPIIGKPYGLRQIVPLLDRLGFGKKG